MPGEYPRHVMSALLAHMEFGLSNFLLSIRYTGYARNEKEVPDFGAPSVPQATIDETLLRVERRKAEILIELFKETNSQ